MMRDLGLWIIARQIADLVASNLLFGACHEGVQHDVGAMISTFSLSLGLFKLRFSQCRQPLLFLFRQMLGPFDHSRNRSIMVTTARPEWATLRCMLAYGSGVASQRWSCLKEPFLAIACRRPSKASEMAGTV